MGPSGVSVLLNREILSNLSFRPTPEFSYSFTLDGLLLDLASVMCGLNSLLSYFGGDFDRISLWMALSSGESSRRTVTLALEGEGNPVIPVDTDVNERLPHALTALHIWSESSFVISEKNRRVTCLCFSPMVLKVLLAESTSISALSSSFFSKAAATKALIISPRNPDPEFAHNNGGQMNTVQAT